MKIFHFTQKAERRLNPLRDWAILVIVTLLLLAASLWWNIRLFYNVQRGAIIGGETETTATSVDQSKLNELIKIFSTRAEEAIKYENGTYRFIDPSK